MSPILYGFGAALLTSLLIGPVLIPTLYKLKFGQYIRTDGPQRHLQKAGTPTMGGLMFLAGTVAGTLLFGVRTGAVLLVLSATVASGIIGFLDDYVKVVLKRSLGLKAREKLGGQFAVAIVVSVIAVYGLGRGTALGIPFTDYRLELGSVLYLIFATLMIVFITNAVNLTDGLDGLAAGSMSVTAAAYVIIALLLSRPGSHVAVFAAALAGGCLGFLWYNVHPAKVFMGDTGSLALGGALASLAVITGTELLLPLVGIIYVAEAMSVVIQVISFKLTGKRVFRMSPLHHHYELAGWSEQKVVRVFWLVSFLGAAVGVLGMYR